MFFILMATSQRSLMYSTEYGQYDASKIPKNFEEVFIKTADGLEIKGWLHKKNFVDKKTILYLHGNAGAINDRMYRIKAFSKMDINFLIISYRGYSENEGSPTEIGLYEDARSAVRFLNDLGAKESDIFLYGESIGAAVAIETGKNKNFAGLILESPFTSMADVAKRLYPIFPVSYVILDRYDSIAKIEHANSAVLIFHGKNDGLIPIKMGREIFESANDPKYLIETDDYHIIKFNKKIIDKIAKFIDKSNIKP